jgi:FkbM family methyltransferase
LQEGLHHRAALQRIARRAGASTLAGPLGAFAERLAVTLGHAFPHALPGRATLQGAMVDAFDARGEAGPLTARLAGGPRMSVPRSPEGTSLHLFGCLIGADERRITALFRRFLRRGYRFADVGAHLGFYALTAASLVGPEGRVLAFEPQAELASHLRRSVALNAFERVVTVHECVVGAEHGGSVALYPAGDPANTGSASTLPHGWVRTDNARRVGQVRLDRVVVEAGLGRLDAMKIDVEGAEDLVVDGMTALFPDAAPRLMVVELMGRIDGSARGANGTMRVCAALGAYGYRGWRIASGGRLAERFEEHHARVLSAIVNIVFTAPGLEVARPELFR